MWLLSGDAVWVTVITWFGIWHGNRNTVLQHFSLINWTSFHLAWNKRWLEALASVCIGLVEISSEWIYTFAASIDLLLIHRWSALHSSNFSSW